MRKSNPFALRRGDLAVATVLLLMAAAILAVSLWQARQPGRIATVIAGGVSVRSFDLEKIQQPEEFLLEQEGYHITVRAEPGRIRVLHSDCPDQVCVRTGWLSRPGAVSACVPARVLIRVDGATDSELDVMLQ